MLTATKNNAATFPLRPYVTYFPSRRCWVLMEEYRLVVGAQIVVIPQYFVFDGASVPRIFWPVFAPFDLSIVAPLVHDWLYWQGLVPRKESDQIFKKVMAAEGVSSWRRAIAYVAVRIFGRGAYNG